MILKVDENGVILWWVDASFAIHGDMRSRSGIHMSLGEGTFYDSSTRQKLNAGGSTEAKLVVVSDVMPIIMWCRHFMKYQGNLVEDVYVYQDNESAILLENNGINSMGKGS